MEPTVQKLIARARSARRAIWHAPAPKRTTAAARKAAAEEYKHQQQREDEERQQRHKAEHEAWEAEKNRMRARAEEIMRERGMAIEPVDTRSWNEKEDERRAAQNGTLSK